MGWREGKDILLYTIVFAPIAGTLQKFKLPQKDYTVEYPKGNRYFYGIKGALDR